MEQNIDFYHVFMDQLVEAASESNWIPEEYFMNDWIADCCNFLRNGHGQDTTY